MAESSKTQWILLIQKTPRGPFSYDEIQELLAQGIIRRNDLAYRVSSESNPGWKFLWQFEEFERRKEKKDNLPERRKESSVENLLSESAHELPTEIRDIQPHELVLKSKRELPNVEPETPEAPAPQFDQFAIPWKPLAIGISICLVGVFGLIFFDSSIEIPQSRNPTETPSPTLPVRKSIRPSTPLENLSPPEDRSRNFDSSPPSAPAVKERDRDYDREEGEIPEGYAEEALEDEDYEPSPPKKKKNERKRRRPSREEEGDFEEFESERDLDQETFESEVDEFDENLPPPDSDEGALEE